ncbi:MAG: hypothetical protein JW729_03720 [Bacteroidales bacterium]|nr:hypothetical protein [Bacteroidales bacterium]
MSLQLKIFNWFFSILILFATQVSAQESQDSTKVASKLEQTTVKAKKIKPVKVFYERDLKIGWDLSNLLIGSLSPGRTGLDFSIDYSVKDKTYAILEFGNNTYNSSSDLLSYQSNGNYFKLGVDFDMRKKDKAFSRDLFVLGIRYGFSSFNQQLDNYVISSSFWPTLTVENTNYKDQAHWIETVAGFKVEIIKNIFLGAGLRFKAMLFQTGDKVIKPAPFVPGYGKTGGTIVVGFNYNIYYNFPLNYSKKTANRAK